MESLLQYALWSAAVAAALTALAEWMQARRIRRAGSLAFGPEGAPRVWTKLAAPVRILAVAALVWGLVVLLAFDGHTRDAPGKVPLRPRDLIVLLDVSPSMNLKDAGAGGDKTRAAQAAETLRGILDRLPPEQVRITMAAFYTDALPLVAGCMDREVVWNFTDRMPLVYAFNHGKTDLLRALNRAGELAADLPRRNATVIVLTDGDTVADTGLKPLPASVARTLILGVGDRHRGVFIDGHTSRQDEATLRQLARRVNGVYHDANAAPVPDDLLDTLQPATMSARLASWSLRQWALAACAAGIAVLALLPALLQQWGGAWKSRSALALDGSGG